MQTTKKVRLTVKPKISGPYSHNLVWESPEERDQCISVTGTVVPFNSIIMADSGIIRFVILKWFQR